MEMKWLMISVLLISMVLTACGDLNSAQSNFAGGQIEGITVIWDEKRVKVQSSDPAYEAIKKVAEATVASAEGVCKCVTESSSDLIQHYKRAVLVELQDQVTLNMPIQSGSSTSQKVEMVMIPLDIDSNVVAVGQETSLSRFTTKEQAVSDLKKLTTEFIQ